MWDQLKSRAAGQSEKRHAVLLHNGIGMSDYYNGLADDYAVIAKVARDVMLCWELRTMQGRELNGVTRNNTACIENLLQGRLSSCTSRLKEKMFRMINAA